ncbi:MAG TPA: winged helix-turn-helix domain-containing protein [Methanothrix sp.]|jgi:ABC-type thiamine transport system substrate-binding protein|nr:winged helix-turn-helix domain-containing protein [Methanothrix sp.]
MPSARYTRIEITEEAYMGLEAEAVLQGKTLKKLASNLILQSISSKALRFVQESSPLPPEEDVEIEKQFSAPKRHRLRISEDRAAIQQIKDLWAENPRPSQREIARRINYPASSAKYQIKMMLQRGEIRR